MSDVERLMSLFAGLQKASGTHGVPERDPDGLKWNIKRTARTLHEPVTLALWEQHVEGKRPLGVIPIREDSMCQWGSIDFDQYDVDLVELVARANVAKLPLVPCRSKSGGLHLFLFLREPEPAANVQSALRDAAASIGMAECEIFPKQTRILAERNDIGQWMVMPYFGGTFDGKLQMQRGLKPNGAEMTLSEFLREAEGKRTSVDELRQLSVVRTIGIGREKEKRRRGGGDSPCDMTDGPRCLEHLTAPGPMTDNRKRTIFQAGIYLKRADPRGWRKKLAEFNQRRFGPPLTDSEIAGVVSSLEKKEYEYKCKDEPFRSHCDVVLCRSRRFGVGGDDESPRITNMSMLMTDPPMYFVDVGGERLELTLDQLQQYTLFHKACLAHKFCFKTMKQDAWFTIVREALKNVDEIPAPPDVGTSGVFHEHLEEFLTNRARGNRREDLLQGRPWEDPETGRHYFTLKSFSRHLSQEGMRDLRRAQIITRIRAMGGGDAFFNMGKRGVRCWWVPGGVVQESQSVSPPPMEDKEPL